MARNPADKPILAVYTTTDSEGKERFTIDEPDGYTHAFAPRSFLLPRKLVLRASTS